MKNFEALNLDIDSEENPIGSSDKTENGAEHQEKNIEVELEEFRKDAENLLRGHKSSLESFSDSVIPELKFSNGVLINFKTMTVHLDTKFFFERKFNQRQMIWAAYHELAHFRDFISDPRRFMENFNHIKEKSEEYGQKIRDVLGKEKNGENDACEGKAYEAWHTFYNCLDDVYVNSVVARGVPFVYGKKGRHQEEVSGLYEKVLFKDSDYSQLPKNRQFSYAILRKAMLPDQEIIFSEEMKDILEREVEWAGKKITVLDFIERLKAQNREGVKAGDRYFMIKKTLEPIFEELYQKDFAEWEEQQKNKQEEEKEKQDENKDQESEPSKNTEENKEESQDSESGNSETSEKSEENNEEEGGQGGAPQNLDDEFNPDSQGSNTQKPELMPDFDPNSGDFDPEKIEDILDQIEKHKESIENENNKSGEKDFREQANEREKKQEKKWCEENNIPFESYQKFEEIKTEIEPYLRVLSELWENIIYGKGKDIVRSTMPANIGEINIDRAIKYYSDIVVGKFDEAKIMDKKTHEILPAQKPEAIKVRFVGDASGSLAGDSEKIKIMQQVYVLLMTSLRDFETKLNRSRTQTKTKLAVHTEGWVFGDSAKKIKSARKGRDYISEQAEIIRQFSQLERDLGGTYDNTAFQKINDELQPNDVSAIKKGSVMDIIFEVTDGGSSNANATRELVDSLEKKGLIVRAFQIGQTNASEDEIFNNVWNKDKKEARGFKIGTEMQNVIPAIVVSLKKYLGSVKI